MKNNENSDTIQKENRKNWLKFAVTLVVCALGGAVLGYGAAWFSDNVSLDALADSAGRVAGACAPFAVLAAALFLIPAAVCWRRGEALCARWDGEDEDAPEQVEGLLNWSLLWLTEPSWAVLCCSASSPRWNPWVMPTRWPCCPP